MMQLRPSEIYFSQAEINNRFRKRTIHQHKNIGETLDDLVEGRCQISDIPTISVLWRNDRWVTADNRRLWVFRHLEKLGQCTAVPVDRTYSIDFHKNTSSNGGRTVRFYPGRYARGKWHSHVSNIDPGEPIQQPRSFLNVSGFSSVSNSSSTAVDEHSISRSGSLFSASEYRSLSSLLTSISLNAYNSTSSSALNVSSIRFTKEKIVINDFFNTLTVSLRYNVNAQNNIEPITVYKTFGKYWVTDGNKRLWCHKEARLSTIRTYVKDDKDEFLDLVRKERPWLSLIDILQSGENIEVIQDN